ncbi:MAG: 2-oxoglutarate dehydrogenase E1 component, partial [Chlamydiia bacterium]|nr:2-oxoglutarate dehydrogenase E1 component [Chlamydiia bacterium]
NPASVPGSWAAYFASVDSAEGQINHSPRTPAAAPSPALTQDHRVFNLILAYRAYGHLRAKVNPIATHTPSFPYELDLSRFGFKERDLGIEVPTGGLLPGLTAPLKDIIAVLEETYCGRIGLEYMDLQNPDMETWLQQEIEPKRFRPRLTIDQKKMILNHLNKSELFESFLHTKYTGQKRFSLEGGETLIPILGAILETGSELGLSEFYIGMAHRGRLNVLSNILNKSYGDIFSEFEEGYIPDSFEGSGDVKYHKGFKSQRTLESGREISVHLAANPSHLEAVNPLVQGQVRARQILMGDERTQQKAIPILIHGDAAVAGQGIVYETLQLCHLPGYSVGGTIHVVVNNQIGFTTLPKDARSTRYCTDIAKSFGAPVFHVNAEDPEGCVYATNLALELRQRFHTDVFIELNCWRKYGHNESDEPAYTQPLEYQLINSKRPVRELYRDDLIHQGVVERQVAEQLEEEFKASLQAALDTERGSPSQKNGNGKEGASNGKNRDLLFQPVATAVPLQTLKEICARFSTVPEGFTINRKLKRIVEQRVEMLEGDAGKASIDWGMGEHLAMASLLWDGTHVRLSGQDSRRGTFSQRHAMWVDQKLERKYFPLSHLKEDQGRFDVFNSPLSEYAVMGFDMGYSLANPEALVMWEAQFG